MTVLKMPRTRIIWTVEERRKVARAAFEFKHTDYSLKDHECIHRGQDIVMPPNRRRDMHGTVQHIWSWLNPLWLKFAADLKAGALEPMPERYVCPANVLADEEAPAQEYSQLNDPASGDEHDSPYDGPPLVQQQATKEHDILVTDPRLGREKPLPLSLILDALDAAPASVLLNEMFKRLNAALDPDELVKRIRNEALDVVNERLDTLLNPRVQERTQVEKSELPDPGLPAVKAGVKRVMVLGLMQGQEKILQSQYPTVDFIFMTGSEGHRRLDAIQEEMDLTIRAPWLKAKLNGATGNWKNYVHVGSIDGVRFQLKTRLNLIPTR